MKIINEAKSEMTYRPAIESHKYILEQCKKIEELYNCEVHIKHNDGIEYTINIIDKESNKIIGIFPKNYPGKTKNYLKGLIDAYKLLKTK